MHQRRRIVLLFGLGIVLPSLLLGYLAFRGVQNDRALLEKERLEETRRAADKVVRAVDDETTAVERALAKAISDHTGSPSPELSSVLEKMAAEAPLVEQVFCLRDSKEIQFPIARLLYIRDGSRELEPSPPGKTGDSAEFQAAERFEFRENSYPRALAAYRQALGRATEPRLAGLILNAVARVQRKSGLFEEAVATYETIVRDHGKVIIPGGMPLGPSAALEICALSRELGNFTRALQASIGLFRSLLRQIGRAHV